MTKDDFHFSVPEVCKTAKDINGLVEILNQFIVSGYNVGVELTKRTGEYLNYTSNIDILWEEFLPKKGILASNTNGGCYEHEIIALLDSLGSISSSNTKIETLNSWLRNRNKYAYEIFTKFIYLTLSSVFTFDATIKIFDNKLPEPETGLVNYYDLEYVLVELEKIGFDTITKPKEKVQRILKLWNNSNIETRKLIEYIISRKLDIGMNEKTFFDVLNPLSTEKRILLVPYQRCEKEDKIQRIKFPCMAQLKADGKFQNVIFDQTRNIGLTLNRSGMRSHLHIFEDFIQFNNETKYFDTIWGSTSFTLTGEALVRKPNTTIAGKSALDIEVYERETGNGLLTSYGNRHTTFYNLFTEVTNSFGTGRLQKKLEKLIAQVLEWKYVEDNTIFQLWNMFPTQNWLNLNTGFNVSQAFNYCQDFIIKYNEWIMSKNKDTNLVLIHNEYFEDLDSVYDLYYRVLAKKMEGLVVKNLDAIIEHGVCTTGIIKLKDFKDCELKVIGFLPGTGKYTGGIGSVDMTTECGRMILNVAGLTDKQRGFIRVDPNNSAKGLMLDPEHNNEKFNGKIFTVKYNKLSKDKTGKPSLSLPSIMEERTDVTRASFLHEIK